MKNIKMYVISIIWLASCQASEPSLETIANVPETHLADVVQDLQQEIKTDEKKADNLASVLPEAAAIIKQEVAEKKAELSTVQKAVNAMKAAGTETIRLGGAAVDLGRNLSSKDVVAPVSKAIGDTITAYTPVTVTNAVAWLSSKSVPGTAMSAKDEEFYDFGKDDPWHDAIFKLAPGARNFERTRRAFVKKIAIAEAAIAKAKGVTPEASKAKLDNARKVAGGSSTSSGAAKSEGQLRTEIDIALNDDRGEEALNALKELIELKGGFAALKEEDKPFVEAYRKSIAQLLGQPGLRLD